METLTQYLNRTGATDAEFASAIGVSSMSVSRMRRGLQWPSLATAMRIARVTQGRVRFDPFEMGGALMQNGEGSNGQQAHPFA